MNDVKKFVDEGVEAQIEAAKTGDTKAAYELLEDFAMTVQAGGVPHEYVMDYIADCFTDIVKTNKANEALNIPNPEHRPPRLHGELEDLEIAEIVEWKILKNMERTGKKQETLARQDVAAELGVSFSQVEKKHLAHKKAAEQIVNKKLRK